MQVKKFEAKTMKEALELVKVHMGPEAIILSAKDAHRGFGLMGEKSVEVTAAVSDETLRKKKVAESKLREDLRERFQQIPASKQKEFIDRVFQNREMVMAGDTAVSMSSSNYSGGARPKSAGTMRVSAASASVVQAQMNAESRAQVSGMRYADIPEEDAAPQYTRAGMQQARGPAMQMQSAQTQPRSPSQERVRRAAERARAASQEIFQDPPKPATRNRRPTQFSGSTGGLDSIPGAQTYVGSAVTVRPGQIPTQTQASTQAQTSAAMATSDVRALESQVRELKSLVERFQHMPQISMTMHPGAEQGLPYELSPVYQRLTGQGIHASSVTQMLKKAQKELDFETAKKPAMVEAWIVGQLLNSIEVSANPIGSRYHVFLGSTGQGKTTSLVKFASNLVLKEKKTIAVISLDTFKVGAADQLRIFAQILNVPFAVVRTPAEWRVAEEKLKGVQHILVDCPGFNLRSMEEADWLKSMLPPPEFGRSLHYVQSALARDEEAMDLAGRYQMLGFHDVIFTRLDESSRQGMLLNFQERFRVPLHSFGVGPRIPEDYEFATKERVIDFIFKLSKVSKREE